MVPREQNVKDFMTYLIPGDKVLNAGCGFGGDSVYLAERGFEVWGTDVYEWILRRTGRNSRGPGISLSLQGIENMRQFPENMFDAACSCNVLHQVPNLQKAASELSRVIKPDGVAYIVSLLNMQFLNGKRDRNFHSEERLISIFGDYFDLVTQRKFVMDESDIEEQPHMHDALTLVLRNR